MKHGFALTRRNWCELNWGFDKSAEEIEALVEGRGNGDELAQIPRYLSGEDEEGNPIPPWKKARIIPIRPSRLRLRLRYIDRDPRPVLFDIA